MAFPVSINGTKYDVKRFLHDHPGGSNLLEKYRGKSVLRAMEKFEHSSSAYHMLNDFKLETLNNGNLNGLSENGRLITNAEDSRNEEEIAFLEELESKIDWSKPLLGQLAAIAPHYTLWVHSAVYRRCRLISNPILEAMTYTPWYLVPIIWLPVILYMLYTEFLEFVLCGDTCPTSPAISPWYFMYQLVLGLFFWTSLEYFLHRWIFHLDPGSSIIMIKLHFLLHGIHHKMPFDSLRLVFPPVPAMIIAFVMYIGFQALVSYPTIKYIGTLSGYLIYDMIHYYVHHGSPRDGTYLYAMKRYHANHHFVNHDKAFGISNKLWDYVFNTYASVRKLNFSLRW